MSSQIQLNHTVAQTLKRHSNTWRVFMRHAPHCLGCALADFCSLRYVAEVYRLRPKAWLAWLERAVVHSYSQE